MKKIFLLLCLVMLICCGCSKVQKEPVKNTLDEIMDRGKIVVAIKTDTYPFGYKDEKGNYAGYDIELAKLISKGLFGFDNKIKFVPVTAHDRMMKLFAEDVDMIIATMSVTPARLQLLDFSNPYYVAGQTLLVRQGSDIKGLRDLNEKKAIIVFGSTGETSLRAAVPKVSILGYKTYDQAYAALKAGKADAIVSDDTILIGYALKDGGVKLIEKRYSREPYAVAFRKGKESEDLIRAVNRIINDADKSGKLRELQKEFKIKKY